MTTHTPSPHAEIERLNAEVERLNKKLAFIHTATTLRSQVTPAPRRENPPEAMPA